MDKHTRMQNLARELNEKDVFNGAWLYAENGEIVSRGVLGFRDPDDTLPITEDTVFQLASISKNFTAAAVMLLAREGKIGLEDEITQFFPEIPYPGVTVRQLLNHTSGIPDYFDDADWFIKIWKEEKRVPGNDEILRFLCETRAKPYFAPGEGLHYSNTGYNLLALLVERLSGLPYEAFLQKNIFEPAGMSATRCCHIRRDGVPFENYARATVFEDGKWVADVDSAEDGDVVAFDGLNGDDYVFTNICDMLRWDRALREGKVLTPEEQQRMYTPGKLSNGEDAVYDEEDELGYGFGWAVGREEKLGLVVSHSGGMPGVATWFERFIDADRVLVILSNRDYRDVRAYMGYWDGMEAIARDKEPDPIVCIEDITIKDPDKSKWESFCGQYEHPENADFIVDEVFLKDGELHAKAIDEDGEEMTFRLYPIGEDEFGRKGGLLKLKFGDGCLILDDSGDQRIADRKEEGRVMMKTEQIRLYPASREQMERMIAAEQDDELRKAYGEMLAGVLAHPEDRDWYAMWMIEKTDGTQIGDLCFKGIEANRNPEIGYGIREAFQGRGYATEAVGLALQWAFRHPAVRAVEAETDPENAASQRVLEKCGFRPLGITGEEGPRFIKYKENEMNSNDIIRLEKPEEYREVENLVREAFWNVYRPGCSEHYVIHVLRNDPAFVKELDFVMEQDGRLIGQNMFMKTRIDADDGRSIPVLTMGPIGITPELKRRGYGKKLLDYSLEKAAELGFGAVLFEGNIGFYGKSGFACARNFGIRYHDLPEGADDSFFLCKELIPGYLDGITGVYQTPQGYYVDDADVEDFDKSFPPREKLKLPGQIFG